MQTNDSSELDKSMFAVHCFIDTKKLMFTGFIYIYMKSNVIIVVNITINEWMLEIR